VKDLRRMVVRLGVELRSSLPSVPKAEFLLALHERFDDQITVEQQRYCVDKWSWPIARKAMQDVAAEAEELSEPRQLMLPLSMGHIKIPRALPIMVKGVPETVTAVFANDAEWYSFSVNATHGYPRDKDDAGRILGRIFMDPEWSTKGLREISRHTAVPFETVRRRYAKVPHLTQVGQIKPVEREVTRGKIGQALVAAGLGNTTASSFMRMGIEASRNGPLSDQQIQQRNAAGMKVLEQRWGDQVPAKLELAKGMIKEASAKWPGLPQYLEVTGLGSDPKLIQQLVARAERRPGRNR
jgi:hypothetical protein